MPYIQTLFICAFICFIGLNPCIAQPNKNQTANIKEWYRVHVTTYKEPSPKAYFKKAGIDKIKVYKENSLYHYYLGFYDDRQAAEQLQKKAVEQGFQYAKIVLTEEEEMAQMVNNRKYFEVTYDELFLRTVHFDMNSAKLDDPDQQLIHEVYTILVRNPNWIVQLSGHSDSVGSPEYNVKISKERVRSVKHRLIEYGIQADRIKTRVFGEAAPIAKNREKTGEDVPAGRQLNRRVCIGIYDENGQMVNIKDSTIVPFDVEFGN